MNVLGDPRINARKDSAATRFGSGDDTHDLVIVRFYNLSVAKSRSVRLGRSMDRWRRGSLKFSSHAFIKSVVVVPGEQCFTFQAKPKCRHHDLGSAAPCLVISMTQKHY